LQLTSELRIGAGCAPRFYLIRLQLNWGVGRLHQASIIGHFCHSECLLGKRAADMRPSFI
jgi:hypothetical protein